MFASELEFFLCKQSYAQANEQEYRNLTPRIPYILDYHILATTMDENVIGQIRRGMRDAGIPVEFSKGEAWAGQHEPTCATPTLSPRPTGTRSPVTSTRA